jgi:hypothetical protein
VHIDLLQTKNIQDRERIAIARGTHHEVRVKGTADRSSELLPSRTRNIYRRVKFGDLHFVDVIWGFVLIDFHFLSDM